MCFNVFPRIKSVWHKLAENQHRCNLKVIQPLFDKAEKGSSVFDGKKVTIEYSKRRGEKFIHKIKEISKAEVEEPPKKKMKTEHIKND